MPSETPGMLDGWRDTIFDFYTPDGATALAEKLKNFQGGTIVVHINETPIKCPVAPFEFAFFCDWCLVRHHKRDKIELVYVTPLPGAFTKPVASKALGSLLEEKRVRMVTDFNAERVDAAAIAKEEGIAELTPAHWKVIEFMQKDFKRRRYQVYAMPILALRRPGTFFFLL